MQIKKFLIVCLGVMFLSSCSSLSEYDKEVLELNKLHADFDAKSREKIQSVGQNVLWQKVVYYVAKNYPIDRAYVSSDFDFMIELMADRSLNTGWMATSDNERKVISVNVTGADNTLELVVNVGSIKRLDTGRWQREGNNTIEDSTEALAIKKAIVATL